jgi:succinate-semialdehyde dehydrogenase/glutarate-semialdehyde dehydrogenase
MSVSLQEDRRTGQHLTSTRIAPDLLRRLAGRAFATGAGSIEVEVPATAEVLGAVPLASVEDVQLAAARARAAQPAWAGTPVVERGRSVLRFHDLLLQRRDEVIDLISLESGKVRAAAFEEVFDTANVARYYARSAPRHLAPRRRYGALPLLTRTIEYQHPVGLVGFITPWNYPLVVSITDAIPALLAGNAVIIKPDPKTPYSALWAASLLDEAGLDPDLVQVVIGEGEALGSPIIDAVDYVMFTGSVRVGRVVARQCGERLKGCSLELGGKNAMIVLDDADLERTVAGAQRACFSSGGQLCIHMERIYLQQARFEEFSQRFAERARAMRLGVDNADMGSLISARQLASVEAHVTDAVARGATVLAGGRARPDIGPFFYEPTVLRDVTPEMTVYANETFGPVVSLYPYRDEEDAIAQVNSSRLGLNFSIWTEDTQRGERLATRLEAGTININEGYGAAWASTDAPMGGFKDSGLGRRHGAHGIVKYTEPQTVAVQRVMGFERPAQLPERLWENLLAGMLKVRRMLPGRA